MNLRFLIALFAGRNSGIHNLLRHWMPANLSRPAPSNNDIPMASNSCSVTAAWFIRDIHLSNPPRTIFPDGAPPERVVGTIDGKSACK